MRFLTPASIQSAGFRVFTTAAFSFIEMLAVIMLIALLSTPLVLIGLTNLNIRSATDEVAGILEMAASYSKTNNTYVWVGFFEEDPNAPIHQPAKAGVGRIVISVVASNDCTGIVDPFGQGMQIDPARLIQVCKLLRIENIHFADIPSPLKPELDGVGDSWDSRPEVQTPYKTSRIGESSPNNTIFPFIYPVGTFVTLPRYTFLKTIQFTPQGEAILNTSYSLVPWIEIGLQPVHGHCKGSDLANMSAIQVSGITGEIKIYRR